MAALLSLEQALAYVRNGEPELTTRQLAILMIVHQRAGPHTVRGLAKTCNIQKPVVTRALSTLARLELVRRRRDEEDRRNVFAIPTDEGRAFLARTGFFGADQ